jgi:cellulase/cellobiase CelA1
VTNGWSTGFQAEITVRNNGTSPLNGWTVRATFANGQTVNQSWSSTFTQSGAVATFKSVSWNAALAVNGSTAYGFLAASNGTSNPPTLACTSP